MNLIVHLSNRFEVSVPISSSLFKKFSYLFDYICFITSYSYYIENFYFWNKLHPEDKTFIEQTLITYDPEFYLNRLRALEYNNTWSLVFLRKYKYCIGSKRDSSCTSIVSSCTSIILNITILVMRKRPKCL